MYLHIYVCICINKIIVLNEDMNWDQVENQSSFLVVVLMGNS